MVTITQIAEELGISTATVSRALNQSRLVNEELSDRIRTTAGKLGYRKREIRRHRGRSILSIKLVLPKHREPERALFYDLSSLIDGIREGFDLCTINLACEVASNNFDPYPHKKGGDINGFIFAFHRPSPETIKKLREVGTPFTILNREINGLPCIASENANGMDQIVSHLINRRGKFKPVYLSLQGLGQIDEERHSGLSESCLKRGVAFDSKTDAVHFKGIHAITSDSISPLVEKYDAFICANDIIGTVVLSVLDGLGVKVPEKIAVTGFDDSPVRQLSRPLLTTISMPLGNLARFAARRLQDEIVKHIRQKDTLRIPGTLVIGQSA